MKKMLFLVFTVFCTIGLFAENDYDNYSESGYSENSNEGFSENGSNDSGKDFYIQPTFGIGAGFQEGNQFGITVGLDADWSVWRNDDVAAGDLYVGMDIAFQYWVPTNDWAAHLMNIPLQANVAYEFQVNAGPLLAAGPWYSMGVSIDFAAWEGDSDVDASFVWGLGGSLAFEGNWALKVSFGGNAHNGHRDYFMLEGAYRF